MQLVKTNIYGKCIYLEYAAMIDVDEYCLIINCLTERQLITWSHIL